MIPLPILKFWREGLIVVLLIGIAGQQVRVANEKAAHQKTQTEHAQVLQNLADRAVESYKERMAEDDARKKATAALDEKHTKELNDEKDKLARLRDDVRTGRVGLRYAGTCPAPAGAGVPQATGTTIVADAEGPRLTPAAERAYFDLRDGITTAEKQIAGLQDYIRNVCLK